MRPIDRLSDVPIEDLRVGDAVFRRKMKRAGYVTLPEAFDASDDELFERFARDIDCLDMLDDLRKAYEKDPEGFVTKATEKRAHVAAGGQGPYRKPSPSWKKPRPRPVPRDPQPYVPPMPQGPLGEALSDFESRAKESFDALADRGTDYLAYEAFEDFPDLDDLTQRFEELFARYKGQLGSAYAIVRKHVPNAFVIFCADRVRRSFDGENLWRNLFSSLGISTQGGQQNFKKTMIACLEQRGMPTYGSDERDFYYFYTALLHGGLTAELWDDLWEKALFPMAKKAVHDSYAFGRRIDGRVVLAEIRSGRCDPGATVLNAIGKASETTLVPMFDAAIRAACQLSDLSGHVGVRMLSRSGLPDTALEALEKVRKRQQAGTGSGGSGRGGAGAGSQSRSDDLIYLPEGKLILDLDIGQARVVWKRSKVPETCMGDRVDFFVNGEQVRSAEVMRDVHGCFIEQGSATLPPMPGYEVSIKLMRNSRGSWVEEASLEQMFMRTKPGCLEFLRMPDGTFRLRKQGDRIRHERTVAYVIKPGRRIVPGPGMKPLETYATSVDWGDRMIHLFEVAPGSSGSIIEEASGRELATWQEDFTVTVDRAGCIGRTEDHRDVYGVVESEDSDNESLPVVTVVAADGISAIDDLDVVLNCDERQLSVRRRVYWREGEHEATIDLPLSEVAFVPHFAERCTLVIRRKSSGIAVFTYSFAVVPVRGYAISQIDMETLVATYEMKAAETFWIRGEGERLELVEKGQPFSFCAPAPDEWKSFEIGLPDQDGGMRLSLRTVGISVSVRDELREASADHPISFADAYEMGVAKGEITITTYGACEGRSALIMLGQRPVFYADMSRPGTRYVNIFSSPDLLLCLPDDAFAKNLTLTVSFGDSAGDKSYGWASLPLLKCQEGLGFVRPQVVDTPSGPILYLGREATCDLGAEFYRPEQYNRKELVLHESRIPKGENQARLPEQLVRKLNSRRQLWVRYFPVSLFDEPEYEYALIMPFER